MREKEIEHCNVVNPSSQTATDSFWRELSVSKPLNLFNKNYTTSVFIYYYILHIHSTCPPTRERLSLISSAKWMYVFTNDYSRVGGYDAYDHHIAFTSIT